MKRWVEFNVYTIGHFWQHCQRLAGVRAYTVLANCASGLDLMIASEKLGFERTLAWAYISTTLLTAANAHSTALRYVPGSMDGGDFCANRDEEITRYMCLSEGTV
jgi:hypothetical protein